MKRTLACLLSALLLIFTPLCSVAQVSAAPALMNFQGRLAKPDGTLVADGNYYLQFSLYNALTGGTLLWQRSLSNVPVKNGTFAARLDFTGGFQNSATLASVFGASAIYLEISINGGSPLTPRQQFLTVAYAFKADSVKDGAITGASFANGTITADKLASNIVWLLSGNTNTIPTNHFLGTTDDQPLEFRVNNRRAVRYQFMESEAFQYRSINILGGAGSNEIAAGVVGATIAGGGKDNFVGPASPNRVTGHFGAVGGGAGNTASSQYAVVGGGLNNTASDLAAIVDGGEGNTASGDYATVGGGRDNTASGTYATIGGGFNNQASAPFATIPGGGGNTASGWHSPFAAGRAANAAHDGTFVWADNTDAAFASTAGKQFLIRAGGGVKLSSGTALELGFGVAGKEVNAGKIGYQTFGDQNALDIVGAGTTNANRKVRIWAEGGTTFTGNINVNGTNYNSDGRYKQHIASIENPLATILNLRGVTFDWNRQTYPDRGFAEGRQIGFIAQEVEKVLPELVSTDASGYKSVAYANVVPVLVEAVKTLEQENDATKRENAELRARLTAIEASLATLKADRK